MGFFHVLPEKSSKKQIIPISSHTSAQLGCSSCTLDKEKLRHPKMDATGSENPVLYFIAEAPGEVEDEKGVQQVGPAGQVTRSRIPSAWNKKIRWNNIINCRPPNNREPSELEIACCKRRVAADIMKTKPQAIVGFGNVPLLWFIGQLGIKDVWRGRRMSLYLEWKGEIHKFWYYPILHPSFVRRMGGESYRGRDWGDEFSADLARVFKDAETGFDEPEVILPHEWRENIRCWNNKSEWASRGQGVIKIPVNIGHSTDVWVEVIKQFTEGRTCGFDIETDPESPYSEDSQILTMSFSDGLRTIAYPIHHPEAGLGQFDREKLLKATKKALLKTKQVIAQNGIFEQEWLIHEPLIGSQAVYDTKWGDSMAQAYTLDSRSGGKGLDDLTLQCFGTNIKLLSNLDINNLRHEPLNEVLMYNGMDSKGCVLVWKKQRKELAHGGWLGGRDLTEICEAHERRCGTMARMVARGVYPNLDRARELHTGFTSEYKRLVEELNKLEEVQKYIRQGNRYKPLAYEQQIDILRLCGFQVGDTTEETLSKIKHPFAKLTLKLRGINKLDSTYVEKVAEGDWIYPDGYMHPDVSHLRTSTGRTAIEDPPLQQWPKREEETKIVRGVISGIIIFMKVKEWLAAFDYGQIEWRVIAMAVKRGKMVDYCWTDYDVHGFWTRRIKDHYYPQWVQTKGIDTDPKRWKRARDIVKNRWTFAGVFGSMPSSRAGYLGIPEEIVEKMDKEFWEDIPEVKKWHEVLIEFHRKHRYAETLTGRRRHWGGSDTSGKRQGKPLSPQQIINLIPQGTAADIVQDAQERLDKAVFEDNVPPWCAPFLNIHDDLMFRIPNKDSVMTDSFKHIGKVMCLSPYPFVNVPLIVEASIGKVWDDMREVHKFSSVDYGVKRVNN